jgi:hypothetical protein
MSDDDFGASWADEDDLKGMPSWAQYQLGYRTIAAAMRKENPDETLFAQLTYPELTLIPFALLVTSRMFPELIDAAGRLSTKLHDLSEAQQFLGPASTEEEE